MVGILAEPPGVHVTSTVWACLPERIGDYGGGRAGKADRRLGLAPAETLDEAEKLYMLRAAFMAHPENLVARFPRFAELYAQRGHPSDEGSLRAVVARFGPADVRDLQALSNLAWFDRAWQL